jgi:hypothetical protein
MRLSAALFVAALALPPLALADAKAELGAAFDNLLDAPSFRASMSDAGSGEKYVDMEFQAPDRYRIINAQGGPTMVIVGRQAQMDVGGRMMTVPVPIDAIVNAYRNEEAMRKQRESMVVEALPDATLDGAPAKVYRFTTQHPKPATSTAWVGAGDTLLQMEVDGGGAGRGKVVRVRYSDIGSADIRIP